MAIHQLYEKVNAIAKQNIYEFIKMNGIGYDKYTYHSFFNQSLIKYNIRVLPQKLRENTSGITIKDRLGVSISYNKQHHLNRQNFTKCHELGHIILEHEGNVFASTDGEEDTTKEQEANLFAACILIPDIILVRKILRDSKTFQDLAKELEVSAQALKYRLDNFLDHNTKYHYNKCQDIVNNYQTRKSFEIVDIIAELEDKIETEFDSINPSPLTIFEQLFEQQSFVSNYDIPEIDDKEFRTQLKSLYPTVQSWSYWDYGETITYVWDTERINWKTAQKQAINEHFKKVYHLN